MSLKDYKELLEAGFEDSRVGLIPPSLDEVLVGDMERTRLKDIKVLIFLGCLSREKAEVSCGRRREASSRIRA